MATKFGEFLYNKRMEKGIGLRAFCLNTDVDPSNYSKYERGVAMPPNETVLRRIAKGLAIKQGTQEWKTLTGLAAAGRGELPSDLKANKRLVEALPALYSHLRDHELPDGGDPFDALIKVLKKAI